MSEPRYVLDVGGLPASRRWAVLLGAPVLAALLVLALLREPFLVLGAAVVLPVGVMVLRRTDLATLLVIFLLYANVPVVLVKFHGVPKVLGSAVTLLLVLPLAHYLLVRRERIVVASPFPLVLVLLAIQTLGVVFSDWPDIAVGNLITFALEGVALYFLITNLVRTRLMLRAAVWSLLAAGAFMGSLGLFQQVTGTFQSTYGGFAQVHARGFRTGEQTLAGDVRQPRLSGPIGEKNRYAQVMWILIPLGLYVMWSEPDRRRALVAGGLTAVSAAGGLLAFSRSAAVAFGMTVAFAALMRYLERKQLLVIAAGSVCLLLLAPQYLARLVTLDTMFQVLGGGREAAKNVDDGAVQGRTTEMLAAALVFLDHPLIGVGPGMFKYYSTEYAERVGIKVLGGTREAHILYLDVAANTGALGLGTYMAIVLLVMRGLHRTRNELWEVRPRSAMLATGFQLALFFYLAMGIFLHPAYIRYYWIILALAAAASRVAHEESEPDEEDEDEEDETAFRLETA